LHIFVVNGGKFMKLSNDEFDMATRRADERLRKAPIATSARYDGRVGKLIVDLSTGLEIAFRPEDAQGLENAKPVQLTDIEISPSGLGIHFPKIDADIYIPALLEGFMGSKNWMAAQLGKRGGAISTEAKAAAARENGKRGGRPRKAKELAPA
jgi:hypothetical protein